MADTHAQPGEDDNCWITYLHRIAGADAAALSALYDETGSLVYGVARSILGNNEDAEEITLDVYAYVWRSAAAFDRRRGSVSTWLTMLARSRALDRLRSLASDRTGKVDCGADAPFEEAPRLRNGLTDGDRSIFVCNALDRLCPDQRALVELAFFSGFSHQEISSRLDIPLGTVKSRIRVAISHLRDLTRGRYP